MKGGRKIDSCCEVCGSKSIVEVLNLGEHPLCDDLIPIGSNTTCAMYPIDIVFCTNCFTAFQNYDVEKKLLFPQTYHYRARMTGSVLSGMKDLVANIEERLGDLKGKLVLDIGCNDGSLLNFFEEKGSKTIGIEPTAAANDSKHETINKFFDAASATYFLERHGYPDVITFTNVFAHINNLPELLENLKIILGEETTLVIENHYLGSVLDTDQFDTFYHEHPRTYSQRSFEFIAQTLGKTLFDVQYVSRYGGNIRVYIGSNHKISYENKKEDDFLEKFKIMEKNISSWQKDMRLFLEEKIAKYGKLRAKAFPGRAAILVKLLGLDENHISAVYEITGSKKVHNYLPGTKIPILPESELYASEDISLPILNLAWHLPSEVRANLKKNGYLGEVFDIKEAQFGEEPVIPE